MTRPLVLILSMAFIASGCFLTLLGFQIAETARASENWPDTSGVVTSSTVKHSYDGIDGHQYSAEIEYQYLVSEKRYTNNQVSALKVTTNDRSDAEAIADKYRKGQSISVHYNPDNPQEALLEAGASKMTWLLAVFGAAFTTVSAAIFLAALFVRF